MITAEPAEVSATDLSLHMGLSTIAAADPWGSGHIKDDPWSEAHATKLGSASILAEAGSSVQLDGESCGMSLGEHMIGTEDESVHGERLLLLGACVHWHNKNNCLRNLQSLLHTCTAALHLA